MYDVIVVGARCAGSPTAMLLARDGYRVLLVDRSAFPSDLVLSTHLVWQAGVARLARWGLLDKIVASGCPALSPFTANLGQFALAGVPPPADDIAVAYAPRRILLDRILVEAATEAGAELREHCVVEELTTDDQRVTGVRGRTNGGSSFTARASIVIGADGLHSKLAQALQAPEYDTRPPLQGTYFTYWSGVPVKGVHLYLRPYRAVYAWTTNDDLTLVGVNWTAGDFPAVRGDIGGAYRHVLEEAAPELAELVAKGKRESRWIGGSVPSIVRKPYGPGWALVGDAGCLKDPCTAQGISDAFRDAELLARAVSAGLSERQPFDDALADYERQRNDATLGMYEFTCQLAPFEPPPPEMEKLYAALHGNQEQTNRFWGVFAGTVAVQDFLSPDNTGRIMAGASSDDPGLQPQ
jgi:2-polyprenyl-6-methoxyphenol hydroxylase-like FAD-dependent oxidoreductase